MASGSSARKATLLAKLIFINPQQCSTSFTGLMSVDCHLFLHRDWW